MTTRLHLRLVVADHLPLERRQAIRELLGRGVRMAITDLIECRKLEIGEVLVSGEWITEETTEPTKGHRNAKGKNNDNPKRDTTKRYPLASKSR
jgi:hypothetical protein